MKLKIVYDNEANPDFEKGWGFSCLIELNDKKILFDTGWDGNLLFRNLSRFNIQQKEINAIVISHSHWDHIGGLQFFQKQNLHVYIPSFLSKYLKKEISSRYILHEIKSTKRIQKNLWATGELGKEIKEQSLILKTNKGLLIITGCSHPGIRKIFSISKNFGEIWGIIGGMHDFKDFKF